MYLGNCEHNMNIKIDRIITKRDSFMSKLYCFFKTTTTVMRILKMFSL